MVILTLTCKTMIFILSLMSSKTHFHFITFSPYITASRVTTKFKTLIDNIFSNMAVTNTISGNLTASISDHLPQVLVAPIFFSIPLTISSIIVKETGQDLMGGGGGNLLLSSNTNAEKPFKMFLKKIEP